MNPNALLLEFVVKVYIILCLQKHYFKGFTGEEDIKIPLLIRSRNKLKQNRLMPNKAFLHPKYYDAQHMLALQIYLIADFLMMILTCC